MITSTIKLTTARAIYVPKDFSITVDDTEKKNVISVSAKDTLVLEYGEITREQFIKKASKTVEAIYGTFLGIIPDSVSESTFKVQMTEEKFMELGHILSEDESKVGLVTRTLKSYSVRYTAVSPDRQFHEFTANVKQLQPKQLEKALQEDAVKNGCPVLFSHEKPETSEELYGLDRLEFISNGEVVR